MPTASPELTRVQKHWRVITYNGSSLDKRRLKVFTKKGDEQDVLQELNFGDIITSHREPESQGEKKWLEIDGIWAVGACHGWVLQSTADRINCVDMTRWQASGPIPEGAYTGQDLPMRLYTEGFPGEQSVCVVSASGENMWKHLNVEMLFKNISTATVFEQQWGGDQSFTDWVAYYAFNVAAYANLGGGSPKDMVVITRNVLNHAEYPKKGPDIDAVKLDIGRAQKKECEWIKSMFKKKGLPWSEVTFMTAFQFLQRHANWSKEDCQEHALERLKAAVENMQEVKQRGAQQLTACLAEAFDCDPMVLPNSLSQEASSHWRLWLALLPLMGDECSIADEVESGRLLQLRGQPAAQATILKLLRDPNLRQLATAAVGQLWPQHEAQALMQRRLHDCEAGVRASTAAALPELWEQQEARERLLLLLADPEAEVRRAAAEAAGKVWEEGVVRELRACFSEELSERSQAFEALAAMGRAGNGTAKAFLPLLFQDRELLSRAGKAMMSMLGDVATQGNPVALDVIASFVYDQDKDLRCISICALAKVSHEGDRAVLDLLRQATRDENMHVSSAGVRALARVAEPFDQGALQDIRFVCTFQAPEWRQAGMAALGTLLLKQEAVRIKRAPEGEKKEKDTAFLACLEHALDANVPSAGIDQAAWILGSISQRGEEYLVDCLTTLLRHQTWQIRSKAASHLSQFAAKGDLACTECLVRAYDDEQHEEVILTQIWALGRLPAPGNKSALHRLAKALESKDVDVRDMALDSLNLLCKPGDRTPLLLMMKALNDKEVKIRRLAVWALSANSPMGDHSILELLAKTLDDESRFVRQDSAQALADIAKQGDAATLERLQHALKDEHSAVRAAAAKALAKVAKPFDQAALSAIDSYGKERTQAAEEARRTMELKRRLAESTKEMASFLQHIDKALDDLRPLVCSTAMVALADVAALGHHSSALKLVHKAMKNQDFNVRALAVKCLAQAAEPGDGTALEAMRKLLGDSVWQVRKAAWLALKALEQRPKSTNSEEAGCTPEASFGKMKDIHKEQGDTGSNSVESCVARLLDESWYERESALEELAKMAAAGNCMAQEEVVKCFLSPTPSVRLRAAENVVDWVEPGNIRVQQALGDLWKGDSFKVVSQAAQRALTALRRKA